MRLPNSYIHTFARRQNVPALVSTMRSGPEHRMCEIAQYALVTLFTDILKVLYAKLLISRIASLISMALSYDPSTYRFLECHGLND